MLPTFFKDKRLQSGKCHEIGHFAAGKRLVTSGVKFVVTNSGRFRASFPEERGAAKFHQKFHGIFHDNFHARFQGKFSRQHFCCRKARTPKNYGLDFFPHRPIFHLLSLYCQVGNSVATAPSNCVLSPLRKSTKKLN